MSGVAIDVLHDGPRVACHGGPEEPLVHVLPSVLHPIVDGLEVRGDGEVRLALEDSAGSDADARIDRLRDLFGTDLSDANVRMRRGGSAHLATGSGVTTLRVGDVVHTADTLRTAFARALRDMVLKEMDSRPQLLVLVDDTGSAVVVSDPLAPAFCRDQLRRAFRVAGFHRVESVDRWTAAALAPGSGALPEERWLLDWASDALRLVRCRMADDMRASPAPVDTLRALGDDALLGILEGELARLEAGEVSTPRRRRVQAGIAARVLLARLHRGETTLCATVPVDARHDDPGRNGSLPHRTPREVQVAADAEAIESLLAAPWRRMENFIRRARGSEDAVRLFIPAGGRFRTNGALDHVRRSLRGDGLFASPDGPAFVPLIGAARVAARIDGPRLAYDCGLLLRIDGQGAIGSLAAWRGQSLPLVAGTRWLELSVPRGEPVELSVYLRRVDFAEGMVRYGAHAACTYVPALRDGMARIQAVFDIDAHERIDVTIVDGVSHLRFKLRRVGLTGSAPLPEAPLRSPHEENGRGIRRYWDRIVAAVGNDVRRLSGTQFRTRLDREWAWRGKEDLDRGQVLGEVLALGVSMTLADVTSPQLEMLIGLLRRQLSEGDGPALQESAHRLLVAATAAMVEAVAGQVEPSARRTTAGTVASPPPGESEDQFSKAYASMATALHEASIRAAGSAADTDVIRRLAGLHRELGHVRGRLLRCQSGEV